MKKVLVHMTVNVVKSFEIDIPGDAKHEEFLENIIKEDPTCRRQLVSNVLYIPETEEPKSVRFYIKEESIIPSKFNGSLTEQCSKLALYISGNHQPLAALQRLLRQAAVDGDVPADCIVNLWEPLQDKYTVNELLTLLNA